MQKVYKQPIIHSTKSGAESKMAKKKLLAPAERKRMTLIWKPTDSCNLACKYCYADARTDKYITPVNDVKTGISKWADYIGKDGQLSIIFHGGEPMVCGLPYYKEVIGHVQGLCENGYKKIELSMQSNGTLLTEEAIDYFVQNKLSVGLSLDGTEEFNGKTRTYLNGRNSYNRIVKTIKYMKEKKKRAGCIAIVSRNNIESLVEIYDHFKEIGLTGVTFNPIFIAGRAQENDYLAISTEEWNSKMIALFEYYWQNDRNNKEFDVEPFSRIIEKMLTGKATLCYSQESCQKGFVGIDPKGNVYPCGRFCGDDAMKYGNMLSQSIEEILAQPLRQDLLARWQKIEGDCKECYLDSVCYGGCMHNAYSMDKDINQKDPLCEKPLFQHIYQRLETALSNELEGIRQNVQQTADCQ